MPMYAPEREPNAPAPEDVPMPEGMPGCFVRALLPDDGNPNISLEGAYITAGYSPSSARQGASRLAKRPDVAAAIAARWLLLEQVRARHHRAYLARLEVEMAPRREATRRARAEGARKARERLDELRRLGLR